MNDGQKNVRVCMRTHVLVCAHAWARACAHARVCARVRVRVSVRACARACAGCHTAVPRLVCIPSLSSSRELEAPSHHFLGRFGGTRDAPAGGRRPALIRVAALYRR